MFSYNVEMYLEDVDDVNTVTVSTTLRGLQTSDAFIALRAPQT